MTLQTSQLRDFIKATSYIRPDKTYPYEWYYLLEPGRITKTNTMCFCSMVIDCDIKEPVLIEQQKLHSFLNSTKHATIDIKAGKNILISDADNKKSEHDTYDVKNFASVPVLPDTSPYELTQENIDALSIAKSFVSDNENMPHLSVVHMNKNYIASTDNFVMYFESFDHDLPNMLLGKNEISIIQQHAKTTAYDSDRRYFFVSGNFTYSFAKTEQKTPPFELVANKTKELKPAASFTIDKADLIGYCEWVNSSTDEKITYCTLTNESIKFKSKKNEAIEMPVQLGNDFEFVFNSRYLLPALKALPMSELVCDVVHGNNKALVIKDGNFICSLIGFIPENL